MMQKIILSVVVVLSVAFASLAKAADEVNVAAGTEAQALAPAISKSTPENEIPLKLEKATTGQENTSQAGKLF